MLQRNWYFLFSFLNAYQYYYVLILLFFSVESSYQLTFEILQKHIFFLYTELEPREIADLMFQSRYISCNDHDSITDSQQKYKRFMSLLNIVKEKKLFAHFACTLHSSKKYMSVLETLQEVIEPDVRPCK